MGVGGIILYDVKIEQEETKGSPCAERAASHWGATGESLGEVRVVGWMRREGKEGAAIY